MEIHVVVKSVYGNDLMYVVEPGKANLVRLLTGKKTVSERDIYALRGLGIEVIHTGTEQPPTEPQPLDAEDEWVVFGHVNDTRLGYFAHYGDALASYYAQHAVCRGTTGHEQALCHVRIAHSSDPKFLKTVE